jgi:hypothetical protein
MNRDSKYLGFILFLWIAAISTAFPDGQPLPSNPSPTANLSSNQVPTGQQVNDAVRKQEAAGIYSMLTQWASTPISFYGKVVDGQGNPIEGAKAEILPVQSLTSIPHTHHKVTDAQGLFSISGIHGIRLNIQVSKDEYYQTAQASKIIGYVKELDNYSPHADPNAPAIFVLRKKGVTEPLIMHSFKQVEVAKDGSPISLDLITGKKKAVTNALQIQIWTQDAGVPRNGRHPFAWKAIVSVPGGGLQPRKGDGYDFQAPTDGYASEEMIDMQPNDPNWNSEITKDYWIHFSDGLYARATIEFYIGRFQNIYVTSYLNPQPGHTNLEYNPDQKSP